MENNPTLERIVRQRETLLENKLIVSKNKAGHKSGRQRGEERAGKGNLLQGSVCGVGVYGVGGKPAEQSGPHCF